MRLGSFSGLGNINGVGDGFFRVQNQKIAKGRGQFDRNLGNFDIGRDYGDLFRTRSDNTFLIKGSYWFSL